ncbi:MazG-like family protein [Bacillus thuringiensis]|uniref:MazG-like family protein n=1 Tax=Bacillus thuringiensis TaxID=1428 RepID=UPI000D646860|nr:hypothetical protein [Bacillus thuringiensis]
MKDELADVLIYLHLFANEINVDKEELILGNLEKNARKCPVEKVNRSNKNIRNYRGGNISRKYDFLIDKMV